MRKFFDEISIQYWHENKERLNPKSYTCIHNGYVYGDNMVFDKLNFIFIDGNNEITIDEGSNKKTYIKLVEFLCNKSEIVLHKFLSTKAEKYRVYLDKDVQQFTREKKSSTRIIDDNSAIIVNGEKYYVASNLKNSEFFNAIANALTDELRHKCFIRMLFEESKRNVPIRESDELQAIEGKTYTNFKLIFEDNNNLPNEMNNSRKKHCKNRKCDYISLEKKKKIIGDFGEYIVLEYEKQKLHKAGMDDFIDKIEYTAKEVGDNIGYDIKSFTEDGKELFIEVKSTKQDNCSGFYVSQNEVSIANEIYKQGGDYRIYRLYKIDERKGEASLKIYRPPFNTERYTMKIVSWYVEKEKT